MRVSNPSANTATHFAAMPVPLHARRVPPRDEADVELRRCSTDTEKQQCREVTANTQDSHKHSRLAAPEGPTGNRSPRPYSTVTVNWQSHSLRSGESKWSSMSKNNELPRPIQENLEAHYPTLTIEENPARHAS